MPVLLADIGGIAGDSNPTQFTEMNGFTYFVANEQDELWKTDGTEAGTELVYHGSASVDSLTNFNGTLYFSTADAAHGFELWRSDGTAVGTELFLDVRPGTASSGPTGLKVHAGRLLFAARDGSAANEEFFVTDGTIAGTQKLFVGRADYATPAPISVGSNLFFVSDETLYVSDGTPGGTEFVRGFTQINSFANVNGTLYLTANDGVHGTEMWKSDGTPAGTQLAAEIRPGNVSTQFTNLVELNGKLFFGVMDYVGVRNYELWSSDGTAAGTQMYYALELDSESNSGLARAGDQLFFSADSDAFGKEMFVTDGTAAGTRIVRDIRPGGSDIGKAYVVNETVYFIANDGSGKGFWISDGSAAGTFPIGPAPPPLQSGSVTDIGGTAYISAGEPWILRTPSVSVDLDGSDRRLGNEVLWTGAPVLIASPTATLFSAGTTVESITVRIRSPQPGDFLTADTNGTAIVASFDGTVLMLAGADSAETYAQVLRTVAFQSTGSQTQTKIEVQAKNSQGHLAVPSVATIFYSAAPQIDLNGQPDGNDISVIWQSAPINIASPNALISDPDSAQLSQLQLTLLQPEPGDQLTADTSGTAITATFNGTTLTLSGLDSVANYQQVLQSVQYDYTGTSPTFATKQIEITPTDAGGLVGTSAVTTITFALHVDLNTPWGPTGHSVTWIGDPVNVAAPTASILAAGGVQMASLTVQVLNPKADDLLTAVTAGTNITALFSGGTLTLSGLDSRAHYQQVLRSVRYQSVTPTDASRTLRIRATDEFGSLSNQATTTITISWEAFIQPVRDIVPGMANSDPAQYTGAGSNIFFTAGTAGFGRELWVSDGTEAGTVLVKDIRPGGESSDIEQATGFGNLVGFVANDGSGPGLWRSNGTDPGTYRLKSGAIHSLINVEGELFFVSGEELWKSDGTIAGTTLVKDFNLTLPFNPREMTTVGDLLFFGLDDGVHDTELWKSDGTEAGTVMVKDIGPAANYGLHPGVFGDGSLELENINGLLYFVAHDGQHSRLWTTDGTEAGTVILGDGIGTYIDPNNYSAITNLNGTLAMVADTGIDGVEVFLGLGSSRNVNMPEGHSSNPWGLKAAGDSLYFIAVASTDEPVQQLWATGADRFYTELIYDGVPDGMLSVGHTMYFIADGALWHSDGTTVGTKQVIQVGTPMVVSELGRVGDTLYFTAAAGKGAEPYLLRLPTAETAMAGRHLLYENSKFSTPVANPLGGKDAAIATDKVAYLPGQGLADTSSVSSYSRGINGIVIDVFNAGGTLTAADFQFHVGASNSPGGWTVAPAPLSVLVRAGQGQGNSDRIEITWADGVIKNTWLQVTVEGNDAAGGFNTNTGLAASDVFFFGNRVGDSFVGAAPAATVTSSQDELGARFNPGINQPVTSVFDFNRDGVVNAADQLIARNNAGLLLMIDVDAVVDEELAEALVAESSATEPVVLAVASAPTSRRAALAFALATESLDDDSADELIAGWRRARR